MDNVTNLATKRPGVKKIVDEFAVSSFQKECTHSFQLFVDCGGVPGPWLAVGINSTVYTIGWLPEDYK